MSGQCHLELQSGGRGSGSGRWREDFGVGSASLVDCGQVESRNNAASFVRERRQGPVRRDGLGCDECRPVDGRLALGHAARGHAVVGHAASGGSFVDRREIVGRVADARARDRRMVGRDETLVGGLPLQGRQRHLLMVDVGDQPAHQGIIHFHVPYNGARSTNVVSDLRPLARAKVYPDNHTLVIVAAAADTAHAGSGDAHDGGGYLSAQGWRPDREISKVAERAEKVVRLQRGKRNPKGCRGGRETWKVARGEAEWKGRRVAAKRETLESFAGRNGNLRTRMLCCPLSREHRTWDDRARRVSVRRVGKTRGGFAERAWRRCFW